MLISVRTVTKGATVDPLNERIEPTGEPAMPADLELNVTEPLSLLEEVAKQARITAEAIDRYFPDTAEMAERRHTELLAALDRSVSAIEAVREALAVHASLTQAHRAMLTPGGETASRRWFEVAAEQSRRVGTILGTQFTQGGEALRSTAKLASDKWHSFADKVLNYPLQLDAWIQRTGARLEKAVLQSVERIDASFEAGSSRLARTVAEMAVTSRAALATGKDVGLDAKRALSPFVDRARDWMKGTGERFAEHRNRILEEKSGAPAPK